MYTDRHMCDIGVVKTLVSIVRITMSPDDGLTTATLGSSQTLHNTLWNGLPLVLQCRRKLRRCLGWWDSPGAHAGPLHPVDVLLVLHPAHTLVHCIPWMFYWIYIRRTGWSTASHGCSTGFTSGEPAGQGNIWTCRCCRNSQNMQYVVWHCCAETFHR